MSRPLGHSIDTWMERAPRLRERINWKFLVDGARLLTWMASALSRQSTMAQQCIALQLSLHAWVSAVATTCQVHVAVPIQPANS